MELRNIFTRDILTDPILTTVYTFCLNETQSEPAAIRVEGKVVDLDPFEVLVDLDRVEFELHISRVDFLDKINLLEKLRRCRIVESKEFIRILLTNLSFPINPPAEKIVPKEVIAIITFYRWREIDLRKVENSMSAKYLETMNTVLMQFGTVVDDKSLSKIDAGDYQTYVMKLKERGLENSSINDYTRALKASFNRALETCYLKEHPFKRIKPLPQIKKKTIILERKEFAAIRANVTHSWMIPIFDFLILTALRRNDALNLKWNNIDFENSIIQIRCFGKYHPKFRKERDEPLSSSTRKLLDELQIIQRNQAIESDYVFVDPEKPDKPIRGDRFTHAFKSAVREAGLREEITLHSLRRTLATKLKHKGADTNTIKGILAHESPRTTEKYIGAFVDDMAKALEQINLNDFLPE
jgi:integrase